MDKIGVYKIVSPSGRVYVGQSINIPKRWKTYFQMNVKTKRQKRLWRSFKKYGVQNHKFSVLEYCSLRDINVIERKWQEFYKVTGDGLNCVLQKTNEKKRILSKETRLKISQSLMGNSVSDEYKGILRERMKGNKFNTGRSRAQWEKDKISQSMKLISKGEKNNMFGKFGADNPNSKIILNTQTGVFYFGIREASEANNIPYSSLKKQICGNRENKTDLVYAE